MVVFIVKGVDPIFIIQRESKVRESAASSTVTNEQKDQVAFCGSKLGKTV